jgi:hypothetical protein
MSYLRYFSSTNKTDRHDITEILLKVALKRKKKKRITGFFYSLKYLNKNREKKRIS